MLTKPYYSSDRMSSAEDSGEPDVKSNFGGHNNDESTSLPSVVPTTRTQLEIGQSSFVLHVGLARHDMYVFMRMSM